MREATGRAVTGAVTVERAIGSSAEQLSQAGIERPRAEAEALVAAASGLSRESLLLRPGTSLSPQQLDRLEALTVRRAARKPLPYVLGEVEFYSLALRASPSAIVPRPETEVLVEAAIARARSRRARLAVDVGTGGGAIAVALAHHLRGLRVVATDVSPEALRLAQANCPDRSRLPALQRPSHGSAPTRGLHSCEPTICAQRRVPEFAARGARC